MVEGRGSVGMDAIDILARELADILCIEEEQFALKGIVGLLS